MKEKWKKIRGYDYAISNKGRVKRTTNEDNTWAGRILRTIEDKDGYRICYLSRNGKVRTLKCHILVCHYFNGPKPTPKYEVRHKDGIKINNVPSNLAWATRKRNALDRKIHGTECRGETSGVAVLSNRIVIQARKIYHQALEERKSQGFVRLERGSNLIGILSKRFNINVNTLRDVLKGRTWTHL